MANRINPIDHPVCLLVPERRAPSSWVEHIPFAMWLTSVLEPRVFVEIGTFTGTSYCGFCQAIAARGLSTLAFAVDNWKGDPHNGLNGPEVLADLREHHQPRYAHFSTLLEMMFDEAVLRFADKQIDLLHIDGYHTYAAVSHDFETWRGKVSDRGVILFHDVAERTADFGVWRLWEELKARYPSFTFQHEHGLGVLAIGDDLPDPVRELLALRGESAEQICALFRELGRRVRLEMERDSARAERDSFRQPLLDLQVSLEQVQDVLERERTHLARWNDGFAPIAEPSKEQVRLENELKDLRGRIDLFEHEIAELQSSRAWGLASWLSELSRLIARFRLSRPMAPRPADELDHKDQVKAHSGRWRAHAPRR